MEIRQRQIGSVVCLDVAGRLVQGVEDNRLYDTVDSLLLHGQRQILLNFEEVSQVDTSGLAAITAARAAVVEQGGSIKLLNLPRRVHSMLVITRLITLFDVFESEAEALESFRHHAEA
jgi:anti-sigma B factor antagonist